MLEFILLFNFIAMVFNFWVVPDGHNFNTFLAGLNFGIMAMLSISIYYKNKTNNIIRLVLNNKPTDDDMEKLLNEIKGKIK